MTRIGPLLVLVLSLAMSGCWFGHKKPKTSSVPPTPAPLSTPSPKTKPIEPPSVTLPAKPVGSLPQMPEVQPGNAPAETPPPKSVTKPAARKPSKKASSARLRQPRPQLRLRPRKHPLPTPSPRQCLNSPYC